MEYNKFDNEYYIMKAGGKNSPRLAFSNNSTAFSFAEPIKNIELPVKTVFSRTTRQPENPQFTDGLFLKGLYAVNNRIYKLLESMNIYGLQMFPIEIKTPKEKIIEGYHVLHIWNEISAVDKNNYIGDEPNMYGNIRGLEAFSLDEKIINNTPLEKRLLFKLKESTSITLIHESIYNNIINFKPEGLSFYEVNKWNIGSQFE